MTGSTRNNGRALSRIWIVTLAIMTLASLASTTATSTTAIFSNVGREGQFHAIIELAYLLVLEIEPELIIGILLIAILDIDDVTTNIEGCRRDDTAGVDILLLFKPCSCCCFVI